MAVVVLVTGQRVMAICFPSATPSSYQLTHGPYLVFPLWSTVTPFLQQEPQQWPGWGHDDMWLLTAFVGSVRAIASVLRLYLVPWARQASLQPCLQPACTHIVNLRVLIDPIEHALYERFLGRI